jgi:hypothetical protein
MYTIIDSITGLVLFAKFDSQVLEGQTAIENLCDLNNPEGFPIYWDFKDLIFYIIP